MLIGGQSERAFVHLGDLAKAGPVDAVLLYLHGAVLGFGAGLLHLAIFG